MDLGVEGECRSEDWRLVQLWHLNSIEYNANILKGYISFEFDIKLFKVQSIPLLTWGID